MPHPAVLLLLGLLGQSDDRPGPLAALENALTETIAQAEPSVVAIVCARSSNNDDTLAVRGRAAAPPPRPNPFGQVDLADPDYLPLPGEFGSGVVVGANGEILTAFHVIKGAYRIHVRAPDHQAFDAEVIAADPRSDLAVIAPRPLPGTVPPRLQPLPLGNAEGMRKGSFLVVLGNPFNTARDGRASASWGVLSNTMRKVLLPREDSQDLRLLVQLFRHQPTLWQLDTRLNLGMSGGAVVNLKGELVGITTTGGNVEGFDSQAGYAIPFDALGRRVVDALVQGKEAEYGFLGISLDREAPNKIGAVVPGTPAAEGELLHGDAIIAVGDRPVDENSNLSLALSTVPVGEHVKLKIRRGGQVLEKSVLVAKYPSAGEVIATNRPEPWRGLRVDFTSVLGGTTLNPSVLTEMAKGLVGVVEVKEGSPSDKAGLRRGQVVTRVGDRPVVVPNDFWEAVRGLKGPVTLQTDRGPITVP